MPDRSVPDAPQFGEAAPIEASPQTLAFLARRRSASALALTEPAPSDAQLATLLRLATRVPDHGKLAPWRFIVIAGQPPSIYKYFPSLMAIYDELFLRGQTVHLGVMRDAMATAAPGLDALIAGLEAIAAHRDDGAKLTAKLGKLKAPPLTIAVVSRATAGDIPEWEQRLSAGALCMTLVIAAQAMGYGANWITDWYAYDADARALLGLAAGEQVAGFVHLGTSAETPLERVRPDVAAITSEWEG